MAHLEICADAAAVGRAVAGTLAGAVEHTRRAGHRPVIGWPVGRTPLPIVAGLQQLAQAGRLRLGDVHVMLMDDYVDQQSVERSGPGPRRVAESAPYSCRGAALRELVAPLAGAGLSADRLHSPDPADPDAYESLLGELGGVDLFVVAVGASDGHVALNPPYAERASRTRVVDLANSTRRDNVATFGLGSVDEVPARGVTVGLGTVMDARRVLVVAHGTGKRDIVTRLLDTDRFDPAIPATVVHDHPDAVLYVDQAAHPEGRA